MFIGTRLTSSDPMILDSLLNFILVRILILLSQVAVKEKNSAVCG